MSLAFLDQIEREFYTSEELEDLWKTEMEEAKEIAAQEEIYYEDYESYEDFKCHLPINRLDEGE